MQVCSLIIMARDRIPVLVATEPTSEGIYRLCKYVVVHYGMKYGSDTALF